MVVIIVQAAIPVREIDNEISALILLFGLFLWNFKVRFGPLFRIMNLE
jgi:hypothetical protein